MQLRARLLRWENVLIVAGAVFLAVLVRYALRWHSSGDFEVFTGPWYRTLKSQGFAAFRLRFSDYTPPYLYLLYLVGRLFPALPDVIAVKLPAMACDFLAAWLALKLVRLRYPTSYALAALAAFCVLFAPTVVLNSAYWGQSDVLYTTGLLACLYGLLTRRPALAMLGFGLALAFKFQAMFLAPLLVVLALRGAIPLRYTLLVPAIYLLAVVPAWIAGRGLPDLLTIYLQQSQTYHELTKNAPSLYAWIPNQFYGDFYRPGLIWAAAVGFLFVVGVYKSKRPITEDQVVQLALVSVLLLPFVLPKMHDRYFFPADLLSIVYGFYFPRYFYVALSVNLVSFFAYHPFLFQRQTVPLAVLALVLLAILVILIRRLALELYGGEDKPGSLAAQDMV